MQVQGKCCGGANRQRSAGGCYDNSWAPRRVGAVSVYRGQLALRDPGVQGGEVLGPQVTRGGF